MVTIRYFRPAPALRDLISSYYWFETDMPFAEVIRAELAQVRFRMHGTCSFGFEDGRVETCPSIMLSGPTVGPVYFATGGPLAAFGAGLLPAGWAALIGEDAATFSDRITDLAAVDPVAAGSCLERLAGAPDDAARIAAADSFFERLAVAARAVPYWFTRLADTWLTATPSPAVDALVAASGVSARQVERLSRRVYGAGPKLLARKYRALQAAVRLGCTPAQRWGDTAGDAFYDQSHFIREFRSFVGSTPHRFAADLGPLQRLTIARRNQLPDMPRLARFS